MNFSIDPTFLYEKKMQEMLHKTFISTHFALLGRSVFYSIWICMNIGNCHNDILHNHIICHKTLLTISWHLKRHDLAFLSRSWSSTLQRQWLATYKLVTFWYLHSKCSTLTKPRFTAISMVVAVTVYILHLVGVTLFQKTRPNVDHPLRINIVLIFLRKFVFNLWNILSDSRVMQLMWKRVDNKEETGRRPSLWSSGKRTHGVPGTQMYLVFQVPRYLMFQAPRYLVFQVTKCIQFSR